MAKRKSSKEIEAELGEVYVAVSTEDPEDDTACENAATAKAVSKIIREGQEFVMRKPVFTSVAQYRRWAAAKEAEEETEAKDG